MEDFQKVAESPRKVKRVSVSSKRQISIPKEYFDTLGIENEVYVMLESNKLIIKLVTDSAEDFSEEILNDLVNEGYEGTELITEFKQRKSQIQPAIRKLINDTDGEGFTILEELFGG
ncbi:AbrB/MazE/SpoVT family DNA-binding domain-containing protein [Virgibacillus natechei]